jgi:hypothetical protein
LLREGHTEQRTEKKGLMQEHENSQVAGTDFVLHSIAKMNLALALMQCARFLTAAMHCHAYSC